MFFIITLLTKIKEDKEVDNKIKEKIEDFLAVYNTANFKEKEIEEALKNNIELKEFVDSYLLQLNTRELAELINAAKREERGAFRGKEKKEKENKPQKFKSKKIERM